MPAAKIMLIRHAEKPNGDAARAHAERRREPQGADPERMEAGHALVGLFNPPDAPSQAPLAKPMSLFASGSDSLRPKQTLAPLATALNLPIRTFLKGQEPELVAAVKKADDPVLISWQHEAIPEIAGLICGSANGVPARWPGHVYDLIWVLDLQASGAWIFTQVPELVMPGDTERPIGLDD